MLIVELEVEFDKRNRSLVETLGIYVSKGVQMIKFFV